MEKYKNIFTDFTAPYLQNAKSYEKNDFQLKFDHSFDVFQNSVEICNSLNLDSELAETIQIAALFHDVGRFPQYREYGTFRDIDSCNHAILGVRYILRKKLLLTLPDHRRKTVLAAIALHNRSHIPQNIPANLKLAAEIVRDSDKIDILKVLIFHMKNITPDSNVALMGLKEIPGHFTEEVISSVENKSQGSYIHMQCLNDFRLLLLSWAYDLNFEWSRIQMIKRGYVDTIFSQLPKNKRITMLYTPIIEQLNS